MRVNRPKLWLAAALLGVGVGLTAVGLEAGAADTKVREGGTFRVSLAFIDSVDPALAYAPVSWQLLQATCAKLMNYPDKPPPKGLKAVPEVAASYPRVSERGKVYTFTLRSGYRFSTGARLTAPSFARAIARLLDPAFQSPGQPAFGVQYARDIVGSDAVLAGKASTVSGVTSRGRTLVIRLKHPVPDFAARLAMPFFCAVPPNLPADPEGAGAYPSAGPYYIAEYVAGRRIVLRRNRFYGGKRPHHVEGFLVDLTASGSSVVDDVERNTADWGYILGPVFADRGPELTRRYGGKRLFLRPSGALWYFALNTAQPLFRSNVRLRRAANFAIDRASVAREQGFRAAHPTDQYLPPGFPGFEDAHIYPLRGNTRKARTLARGRLRGGKAVMYTSKDNLRLAQAQIVKQNLARIGLDVEIKPFPFLQLLGRLRNPGEPFDIAFTGGWGADYSDPYAYLNVLFDGRRIGEPDNFDFSNFKSTSYNRRLDQASRLHSDARYRAYGRVDVQLARDAAPAIAYSVSNLPTFVSSRVDRRCIVLRPSLDLAAVCLK
jgi:peptide/nickel transport system substrate-binding protein